MEKSKLVYEYEIEDLLLRNAYHDKIKAPERLSMPDLEAFARRPTVSAALLRLQEFIWTLRSLRRQIAAKKEPLTPLVHNQILGPSGKRRILLDVTASATGKVAGGIKSVSCALAATAAETNMAIPVIVKDGNIYHLNNNSCGSVITHSTNDIFVVLDHYWDAFADYGDLLSAFRDDGVFIATCIYDLIPLDYPSFAHPELTRKMQALCDVAIKGSDIIFSISKSSSQDIERYLRENELCSKPEVMWFPLGFDLGTNSSVTVRQSVKDHFPLGGRTFLSVGSMMPHKAHRVAVNAFERLWSSGYNVHYVIVGPVSGANATENYIRSHKMFGRFLFRIDDASDDEVAWAYKYAMCLLQPSIVEGFGLPIIEANRHGLPIIASDIPVFREIGHNSLCYFEVCNDRELARAIYETTIADCMPQTTVKYTWKDSLTALCAMLDATVACIG